MRLADLPVVKGVRSKNLHVRTGSRLLIAAVVLTIVGSVVAQVTTDAPRGLILSIFVVAFVLVPVAAFELYRPLAQSSSSGEAETVKPDPK